MKKAISLLIALAAVCSFTVTAFAAEDDDYDYGITATALEWAPGSTSAVPLLNATAGDLVLSLGTSTTNPQIVLPETYLTPGTEYEYRIYRVVADASGVAPENIQLAQLTEADLDGGKLRIRSAKGSSAISSVNLKKRGSGQNATYNLEVETRTNYGTKMTDVEYTLSVTGQSNTATNVLNSSAISFEVGWRTMDDDDIDSYSEGDTITIDKDTPVFTKKQLDRLSKEYNYKAIEFADDDSEWTYTGRVSGMGDTNFINDNDVIPAIINALPDQDFKFLTFNAGITFPTNGEMRIDVSDISDDYTRIYAYLYRNGTLTPITTTYDSGADEIIFRTNYLGAFVMTDEEITDTDILNPDEEEDLDDNLTEEGGNNPDTGKGAMNVAVTFGLVTLATAGAVASRKRK